MKRLQKLLGIETMSDGSAMVVLKRIPRADIVQVGRTAE